MNSSEILQRAKKLEKESLYEFLLELTECSEILKKTSSNKRKLWLTHVIEDIYNKQNGLCAMCGEGITLKSSEVDHVIPFCYGGGNERNNLQLTCRKCNRGKGKSVDPSDLLKYLEDRVMNL